MAAAKKVTAKKAATGSAHPTFIDMISECIVNNKEDARTGVSRPTIKKFLEEKYKLELNAQTLHNINKAIQSGADKGTFVLPKGVQGKVKLAPKNKSDNAKENKSPTLTAKTTASTKKPLGKATTNKTVAPKKAPMAPTKAKAAPRKAVATAKKPSATAAKAAPKKTTATVRKSATVKKPAASAKKTSTTKRAGAAKKAVTGGAAAKAKAAASKPKPASKKTNAKPASKPASAKKSAPKPASPAKAT